MDGENNGKPYEQMDDLGGKPTIFGNTHIWETVIEAAGCNKWKHLVAGILGLLVFVWTLDFKTSCFWCLNFSTTLADVQWLNGPFYVQACLDSSLKRSVDYLLDF